MYNDGNKPWAEYDASWQEFRDSGLLWFINMILHTFGWAICVEIDNFKVIAVYPKRVIYRGFSQQSNSDGYLKVTKYLKDNIDELLNEASDESED